MRAADRPTPVEYVSAEKLSPLASEAYRSVLARLASSFAEAP
jgi:hypothetical protein